MRKQRETEQLLVNLETDTTGQITGAANEMSSMASTLQKLVANFKLRQ